MIIAIPWVGITLFFELYHLTYVDVFYTAYELCKAAWVLGPTFAIVYWFLLGVAITTFFVTLLLKRRAGFE